jgi:hypothetical protein
MEARGQFQPNAYPAINKPVTCENGHADAIPGDERYHFRCKNVSSKHSLATARCNQN